jgi:hypothetical protein
MIKAHKKGPRRKPEAESKPLTTRSTYMIPYYPPERTV